MGSGSGYESAIVSKIASAVMALEENINLEQAMINTRIAKQRAVLSTSNLAPSIAIAASGTESEQNTAGFPPIFTSFFGNSDEITTFTQEN